MANRTPRNGAAPTPDASDNAPPVDDETQKLPTDTPPTNPPPSLPPSDEAGLVAFNAAVAAAAAAQAPAAAPIVGETADPLETPSGVQFRSPKCWTFYLNPGVGYPGELTVQFIGGVYTAANKAEELALRKIMKMDKGLEVIG